MNPTWCIIHGAVHHVRCAAATNPTWFVAEGVGFEPTSPFEEAVFKTAALNHSAIPPESLPLQPSTSNQN